MPAAEKIRIRQNKKEQNMEQKRSDQTVHPTHTEMKRIIALMAVAAAMMLTVKYFSQVLGALQIVRQVFAPFLVGACIAFVLNVPMRGIEKGLFGREKARSSPLLRKLARPVSLLLTFALLIIFVTLYVLVLVPQLRETVAIISASAQAFLPRAEQWLSETFDYAPELVEYLEELDWEEIQTAVTGFLHNGFSKVITSGVGVVVSVVSAISTFVIGLVFSFYVLSQKEKLGDQARRIVHAALPRRCADRICAVASLAYNTFSNFVRVQCLEAAILGAMFVVAMTIFRMPYALLIGVLIGITALIPVFGAFIGCILSVLMILMVDPFKAVMFVVLFLVLQQIEGNLIYPHVVGSSVGLPSIWVLVAVTVGGSLMGIVGMVLFIPLTSVCYTLLKNWTNTRNAARSQTHSS